MPGHPAGSRINFLPEDQIQLGSMVLDVAHVVQQQLRMAHFHPTELVVPLSVLVRESFDRLPAFPAAMVEVGLKLLFRIGLLGKHTRWIELVQVERSRRSEFLDRVGQAEVEKKRV